ncbi:hypothetical protein QLG07_05950 [Erwinia sp. V90_4]|uniref:hypothetical protein n=1 Tax=Erwinia TaxID=551 RepID=UPI00249F3CCE|nr:hypothetical protein [Erwinia sp. V90_4]MDI3438987.1 hypothetical protein [Erwinia sp. V90_4]
MENKNEMERHLEVTRAIIYHSFMFRGPRHDPLYSKQEGATTCNYFLHCVGSFAWDRTLENSYAMLVVFPVFFDYLDTFVDVKFGCVDKTFAVKKEIIKRNINKDFFDDVFLYYLYDFCVLIRNKMLHHKISYQSDKFIYHNRELKISEFRLINEVIYQFVKFGTLNKSLYERNALYSGLLALVGKESGFAEEISQLDDFLYIKPLNNRGRHCLHSRPFTSDSLILDYIAHPAGSLAYDNEDFAARHPDPDEKIIFSNSYYFYEYSEEFYLIPAELIASNRELRFCDIKQWRFPTSD